MHAAELPTVLYAVIEIRWAGRPAERFALAYQSETSLRNVIARPNIVASGFVSRDDAVAILEGGVMAGASRRRPAVQPASDPVTNESAFIDEPRGSYKRLRPRRAWSAASELLQQLLSAIVIIVFSGSLFARTLRAFISF